MQGPGFSELGVGGGWGQTTQEVQRAQDSGNEDPLRGEKSRERRWTPIANCWVGNERGEALNSELQMVLHFNFTKENVFFKHHFSG